MASSLEEALNITNTDWNNFQLIWITQFCVAEEGCEYEYTPTWVLVPKITIGHAEGSD